MRSEHEIVSFARCAFGDGGHYHSDGFDRAQCRCGWSSAASRDHKVLVALFEVHVKNHFVDTAKLVAACRALFDAPHHEHFAVRLNDEELSALNNIREIVTEFK